MSFEYRPPAPPIEASGPAFYAILHGRGELLCVFPDGTAGEQRGDESSRRRASVVHSDIAPGAQPMKPPEGVAGDSGTLD